jgi:aquaporin TIP
MMMQGDYVRRASAEFMGAFTLVFIGVGALAFAGSLTDIALAYGLAVAVMASAVGHICGAHFNPAITFGFWITRRMSTTLALVYWVSQLAAATLAALLLKWILPADRLEQSNLGAPRLSTDIGAGEGLVVEAVLTFFLAWVIFATAVDPNGSWNKIAGLAIGLTISMGVLMGFFLTG